MAYFSKDEILTDNTKIKYCQQCKDCVMWGETVYSNKYDKACCEKFPFPNHKPEYVLNNKGDCPFRVVRTDGV